jgi:hypothetical protein
VVPAQQFDRVFQCWACGVFLLSRRINAVPPEWQTRSVAGTSDSVITAAFLAIGRCLEQLKRAPWVSDHEQWRTRLRKGRQYD